MEAFAFCLIAFLSIVNLILAISTSIVVTKVFEVLKVQEERRELEEEAKRQVRGLLDIETPQVPYSLRR